MPQRVRASASPACARHVLEARRRRGCGRAGSGRSRSRTGPRGRRCRSRPRRRPGPSRSAPGPPCGDVLERAVAAVAVEVVRRLLALREALEGRAVHQEDVEPAVAVVVEEGRAAARSSRAGTCSCSRAPEDGDRVEARPRRHVRRRRSRAASARSARPRAAPRQDDAAASTRPHDRDASAALSPWAPAAEGRARDGAPRRSAARASAARARLRSARPSW